MDVEPKTVKINILGTGTMIGEDDIVRKRTTRTTTLKCVSQSGSVYVISAEDFKLRVIAQEAEQLRETAKYKEGVIEDRIHNKKLIQKYSQRIQDKIKAE